MIRRRLVLGLALLSLVACDNEKYTSLVNDRADQAAKGVQDSQHPGQPKSFNPLTVSDKVWAGNSAVRLQRGLPLPPRFETSRGVAIVSNEPMQFTDIVSAIGSQTGISVHVSGNPANGQNSNGMQLAYEGPLSGLLDQVAGNFGLYWKYDGKTITFSRFETRVFMIEALPGTQTVKDGMQDSSSGGGGGSGGSSGGGGTSSLQQSTEMNVEFKVWEELERTVSSMLGGTGTVVAAPSGGTMTVTTTPEVMQKVAKFIESENARLSHQIAINVEIYAVNLVDSTDFSFTFDEALRRLAHLNYIGPSGPNTAAGSGATAFGANGASGSISSGITAGSVTGGGSLAVAIINAGGGGQTSGLFSALSSIGDTTRVSQFPMVTLNNRPVSRRIGQDLTYAASNSTSAIGTNTTSTQTTTTPGTLRLGFSLQLTPRLLDDGRIMLQYSLSLIDLVKMDSTTVPGIQLPETSTREFVQQAMLQSGSTLLLGGIDDEQLTQNSQGMGSPSNYLLGGGYDNSKTHSMLFISITPQVLDAPHVEQG